MSRPRPPAAVLALAAATAAAQLAAQVPLTFPFAVTDAASGNARFVLNSLAERRSSTLGSADFAADACAGDNLFALQWYYRIAGDATGSAFHTGDHPVASRPAPDAGVIDWAEVGGRGFAARWTITCGSTGPDRGFARHDLTVTNTGAAPLLIHVYAYGDLDHNGFCCPDTLAASSRTDRHVVTDGDACGGCSELAGVTPDHWEIAAWPALRDSILQAPYTLADRGLAPPGVVAQFDYTGAFQWMRALAPNGSATFTVVLGHDDLFAGRPPAAVGYGRGTGGAAGVPTLTAGTPLLGLPLELRVAGATPGAFGATILLGAQPTNLDFCGVLLLVDPFNSVGVGLAAGAGTFTLPAFCEPALGRFPLYWQAWMLDPSSASPCYPLTHTPGLMTAFGD